MTKIKKQKQIARQINRRTDKLTDANTKNRETDTKNERDGVGETFDPDCPEQKYNYG